MSIASGKPNIHMANNFTLVNVKFIFNGSGFAIISLDKREIAVCFI